MGSKSGYSPLYEYSIIFFIIGFYYTGDSKISKILLSLLAIFYVVFDFLGGQRSTGIQILIILVLMVFTKYLNTRRIIVGAGILLVFITFIGLYRGNFSTTGINIGTIIDYLRNGGGGYATVGFAYHTSLTFLGSMQHYSVLERLQQFCQFFASQFVIGTVGQSLIQISRQYYTHYNGGVLPIYLFYYIGYIGTAGIAWLVSKYYNIMRAIDKSSSGYKTTLAIYIASTTHRWYLYSPNQLLRGALLMLLMFWVFSKLDSLLVNIDRKARIQ